MNTAAIHVELTQDRQRVIMLAGGDLEDVAFAAKQLAQLTPVIKATEPRGALEAPLSWPFMVQLASTFGEQLVRGPRLQEWLNNELTARIREGGFVAAVPAGLTARPYQVDGALLIARTGRAAIFDEPRCLYGDAEIAINRAGKGSTIKLRDLVARFTGHGRRAGAQWNAAIPTYVQREIDGVIRLGRLQRAWCSGIRTTYTVTTETGRTIRASAEHPFLTERGWLRLDELTVGELVHTRGSQSTGEARKPKYYYRHVAGLRAHPYAHGVNRRTSRYRVGEHRLVIEADHNDRELADFIAAIRAGNIDGFDFLDPAVFAVHHIDHNQNNNELANLKVLTHAEHHALHAAEGKTRSVLFKIGIERVTSITRYGDELTYDIEVADAPHNFIANGFVVHNTGKTITTILGLLQRDHLGHPVTPILVVAPASVVDPWVEAFRVWAPDWAAIAWRGPGRHRKLDAADVYVTSYDTARTDAADTNPRRSPLIALDPRSLVIDECHFIKTPDAARTKAVLRLARNTHQLVALSGTPITHHPANAWPTLKALAPGAWPARERWVNRYCQTDVRAEYGEGILGLNVYMEPEFRLALLGQERRVARADVMGQLPPKVYSVRTVELPAAYRKAYDQLESQMLAEMPDGQELSVMTVLAQLTRLSQLASAAADVETSYVTDDNGDVKEHTKVTLKAPSWKVDTLLEILTERPGEQSLVFAPSRQLIMLAAAAAQAAGYKVGLIVGGQSARDRTKAREAFQAGHLDIICATTGAGGTGITLSAAGTLIFLQRPWSLVESLQAEDRPEGDLTKTRGTEVIDIIATNTIDTRVRAILRERAGQLADFVQDPRIVTELLGGTRPLRKAV